MIFLSIFFSKNAPVQITEKIGYDLAIPLNESRKPDLKDIRQPLEDRPLGLHRALSM